MNEEYFVHTLLPFARGTQSGDAAIRQSFRKYRDGRNVPLLNMVMDEFKHVVGGVHLPANVAKMIDANRFHDVLYKIIRVYISTTAVKACLCLYDSIIAAVTSLV